MQIVFGTSSDQIGRSLAMWFAKTTNKPLFMGDYSAVGLISDKGITTVALFNNYNKSNIDIHWSGKFTKNLIKYIANYVFLQLKCVRLTTMPARRDKKLLQLLPRLGFSYEATLKNYYGETKVNDAIVYTINKNNSKKWID